MDAILSNCTSVSIAHRLTTIMKSDKIIVMEDGQIKEIGNHDDLMKRNGIYTEMYDLYLSTQTTKYLEKNQILIRRILIYRFAMNDLLYSKSKLLFIFSKF